MAEYTDENRIEQLSFDSLFDDNDNLEASHSTNIDISYKISTLYKTNGKTYPLHLVVDFNKFMNYIGHHPVQLTKTMEYITSKHLPSINKQIAAKAEDTTGNTQQESYPYAHFFYYIALAGNLLEKVFDSGKLQLRFTKRWSIYKELTDTEQFFYWRRFGLM